MKKIFWHLLTCICLCAMLGTILAPNFVRARSRCTPLTVCKSNLKNIGAALEMYREEHQEYPAFLDSLAPKYWRQLPTCPRAKEDTYTASYAREIYRVDKITCEHHPEDKDLESCRVRRSFASKAIRGQDTGITDRTVELACPEKGSPYSYFIGFESYRLFCQGEHHSNVNVPANYPQYNGISGLIEP